MKESCPLDFIYLKKSAFVPVSKNFEEKWKTVLLTAEKDLLCSFLAVSDNVIVKVEFEIESNLKILFRFDF